jgi:hypothetical protein
MMVSDAALFCAGKKKREAKYESLIFAGSNTFIY